MKDCTRYTEQFADYYRRNPVWGRLHIVLEDGNFDDGSVVHCLLRSYTDEEFELACLLLAMSKTQRVRTYMLAERMVRK